MAKDTIAFGPVTVVSENLGWIGVLHPPRLTGYYGEELEWTLEFDASIESITKALGIWLSFESMALFGQEQASAIDKLSRTVTIFQEHYESKVRELEAQEGTAEQVRKLKLLVDFLSKHQATLNASPNTNAVAQPTQKATLDAPTTSTSNPVVDPQSSNKPAGSLEGGVPQYDTEASSSNTGVAPLRVEAPEPSVMEQENNVDLGSSEISPSETSSGPTSKPSS